MLIIPMTLAAWYFLGATHGVTLACAAILIFSLVTACPEDV